MYFSNHWLYILKSLVFEDFHLSIIFSLSCNFLAKCKVKNGLIYLIALLKNKFIFQDMNS